MKVVGIIIGIILIVAIGFMVYRSIVYMVDDNFTLGDAVTSAWDDLIHIRISKATKIKLENLASRDAEFGIQYLGLRTLD